MTMNAPSRTELFSVSVCRGWRRGCVPGAFAIILLCILAVMARPVRAQSPGSGGVNSASARAADYVLLISFDAFRYDYLDRGITPNFDRVIRRGARADALIPIFPTKTYPNHYSIATGMYAGTHGLVGNDFYDPIRDATYSLSDRSAVEDGRWYGGEPIWVTAEKSGMVAAALFFIGTEAPVQGVSPTTWTRYEHRMPMDTRIATVLGWFSLPEASRPHVITTYFPMTDDAGHRYGPESPELSDAIREVDSALGRLLDGIEALPYGDRVNIVLVSDHGMTPARSGSVNLDEFADLEGVRVIAAGPIAYVYTASDTARRDRILAGLARAQHMRVFAREQSPEAWHVRGNARAGDIIAVADEGWLLRRQDAAGESSAATHGYAPMPSMHGIFVAAGPGVRRGMRVPAFENIHVYPFLSALLGLEPNPDIDGRAAVLAPILQRTNRRSPSASKRTPDP
jgi:predicted AlkP superfamily pyrophosphatase or phosphodiesterase